MAAHKNAPGDAPHELDPIDTTGVAPGNLLELTEAGRTEFSASLRAQDGLQEGYRDDVLYLLTKDLQIKGRDLILAMGNQLKRTPTQ
jgi:hypothetical protein